MNVVAQFRCPFGNSVLRQHGKRPQRESRRAKSQAEPAHMRRRLSEIGFAGMANSVMTSPVGGSRKGAKRERGEDIVRTRGCPRNCKRQVRPERHWRFSGKAERATEPRARR